MQHWQKDRMKLVITLLLSFYPIVNLIFGSSYTRPYSIPIMLPIVIYWGYRWTKGDISFKNPNKNNP